MSDNLPNGYLPDWADGRPKRETSPFGHVVLRYVVSTRYEGRGVECRPTVTENGHTEWSNPSRLSHTPGERREVSARCWIGVGDQAGCLDDEGYPKKQRLWVMPEIG